MALLPGKRMESSLTTSLVSQVSDSSESFLDETADPSLSQRLTTKCSSLVIEPILFLMMLARTISGLPVVNFFELKSCESLPNISAPECLNMTQEIKQEVQIITSNLVLQKSLIETLIPAFLTFFIGHWSDVNGRRPLLLIGIFGLFCFHLFWAILSAMPEIPSHFYLLCSLPITVTGGWSTILPISFSYIVDITTFEARAFRLSTVASVLSFGFGLGFYFNSIIFRFGYSVVFGGSAVIYLICYLLTYFCLEETIKPEMGMSYNFFNFQHVLGMFRTIFFHGSFKKRLLIFLSVAILALHTIILLGEMAIYYLWTELQFHWSIKDYNIFQIFNVLLIGVGTYAGFWLLSTIFRIPDLLIAFFVMSLQLSSSLMSANAVQPWHVYAASVITIFSGTMPPLVRAAISKIVSKHETGKVFALIGSLEAVVSIIATPLYTLVYDTLIKFCASYIFYLSAALYSIILVCLLIMNHIFAELDQTEFAPLNEESVQT